jgi:hypothetical protein
MKRIIINESQFSKLVEFEKNHNTFMSSLASSKKTLNESFIGNYLLKEATDTFNKAGRELKEKGSGVGLGISLMEGALSMGIPSQTMITLAEELGVPPKERKNMMMGYYQKLDKTDKFLSEEMLQEGLFNYLRDLLKGKTGENLKRTIISLVLAGKLAMISSTALADTANKIDGTIDIEKFKTELEAVKANKGEKGKMGASLTPEQKQSQLDILETSKIVTADGQTLPFDFNGSLDSFDAVNGDNYPQYNEGSTESNNLNAAFAKAEKTGEGVVNGKCTFMKNGKGITFEGQFIQANGLWYKFTPKAPATDPTPEFDGIATPSDISTDSFPNDVKKVANGTGNEQFKRHDLSGLMQNSGGSIDKLVQLAKTYNPELKKISSAEIKRAIETSGSLKTVNVDMSKVGN